jgi:hypothetical protein
MAPTTQYSITVDSTIAVSASCAASFENLKQLKV